jgi:hypothetical protein
LVIQLKLKFALLDVERFIFSMVNMRRRPNLRIDPNLDEGVLPSGVFAHCLEGEDISHD